FTGNDLTVMRDGIRQNTTSQSARTLDSFLFERIEVLKGPASLLYGEGAIGGAVNYVSKLPGETFGGEINVGIGSWDGYRVGVGVGGPTAIENVFFRADLSSNRSGGYVDASDSEYDAYAAALRWDVTPETRFTLSGTYLRDDVLSYYGTPVVYDAVVDQHGMQSIRKALTSTDSLVNARIADGTRRRNYNNRDNFARAENSFARAIVDTELNDSWALRNEVYLATQHLKWRNTESTVWNPVTQLVDRSSFFLIYRNDYQIGDRLDLTWESDIAGRPNKFLIGGLYENNEQLRNSGQTYPTSPTPASVPLIGFERGYGPDAGFQKTLKVMTDTGAVYIENIFEPIPDLNVVAGLRRDWIDVERISYVGQAKYEKSYMPDTGRFGLIYAITPTLNVYGSYTRAAQPVSQLVSLSAAQDEFSLQTGQQYEIGSKASLLGGAADLTVAVFDIEKNDLLTTEVVNGVRLNSQVGAQVSRGAEIAFAIALPEGWHVDANLAWTWKAEFDDFNENLGAGVISRAGNTPPNVPKRVVGLFVARDFGAWKTSAGLRHVGDREANNNNAIHLDDYTTLDVSIGYRWQDIGITLWGRNLTDEEYVEWASGSGLMQRIAEPRSYELTVKYAF
ncbi:MAG: TonB-dependent receptor, partial [Spongiibacteraceae bacterium]